jgi:hypothetical protein
VIAFWTEKLFTFAGSAPPLCDFFYLCPYGVDKRVNIVLKIFLKHDPYENRKIIVILLDQSLIKTRKKCGNFIILKRTFQLKLDTLADEKNFQ